MPARTVLILGGPGPLPRAIARRFSLEGDSPILADPSAAGSGGLRALVEACAAPVAVLVLAEPLPGAAETAGERAVLDAVARHCWPLVESFRQIQAVYGAHPGHVLVLAGAEPAGTPAAEAARAVNEVLVPYLNHRFTAQNVNFNLLRLDFRSDPCEGAARMVFALTSGLMDALRGQILNLTARAQPRPALPPHPPARPEGEPHGQSDPGSH